MATYQALFWALANAKVLFWYEISIKYCQLYIQLCMFIEIYRRCFHEIYAINVLTSISPYIECLKHVLMLTSALQRSMTAQWRDADIMTSHMSVIFIEWFRAKWGAMLDDARISPSAAVMPSIEISSSRQPPPWCIIGFEWKKYCHSLCSPNNSGLYAYMATNDDIIRKHQYYNELEFLSTLNNCVTYNLVITLDNNLMKASAHRWHYAA